MAIVFPNEAVAHRWNGARQARLDRAPLAEFLRAQAILPAPAGPAQDSDNLTRATVSIVEAGLARYGNGVWGEIAAPQRAVVGHVACLVSRSLAELIHQPGAWRIAALVGTARLLAPSIGLGAAAAASASAARHFERELAQGMPAEDARIGQGASAAVNRGGTAAMAEISALIAMRLSCPCTRDCARSRDDLPQLRLLSALLPRTVPRRTARGPAGLGRPLVLFPRSED